jgi:GDP-L-fucose synthase
VTTFNIEGKRVFVAGHRGMVGSALVHRLAREDCQVLTVARDKLDLLDQAAVRSWMTTERPQAVIIAAARVGGIYANDAYPADFIHQNLVIETNLIEAAYRADVEKLAFLGSSCIYPTLAPQPIPEEALLTGPLEATNQWYAVAKIAGLKMCEAFRRQYGADFISAMPTNLYGPGDNFDLEKSHVIPALIRKAHAAKIAGDPTFTIWGSGTPRREFLHVDDAADAIVHLLKTYSAGPHINVGTGGDLTIMQLTELICEVVGFKGRIVNDPTKPDGTPQKLLDVSRLFASGWRPKYDLKTGLRQTYAWYCENIDNARLAIGARQPRGL